MVKTYKPKVYKHNPVELAWAAGLFDGEGSSFAYRMNTKHPRKGLKLSIGQDHNPEVLYRFQDAVKAGAVCGGPGPKKNSEPRKFPNRYTYFAYGPTALGVLRLLWPFLSTPKKRQANRAYKTWSSQ